MYKVKLRNLGMSALVGAGLIAAGPAGAYNVRLGNVDVQIDTIASVGVSVRVADRNMEHVAQGNGGNEPTKRVIEALTFGALAANPATAASALTSATQGRQNQDLDTADKCLGFTKVCMPLDNTFAGAIGLAAGDADNFDQSINGDDARLNFDNGDLTGGTVKFTSDIEGTMGNIRGFMRVNAFYDAVLGDEGSFERSKPLSEADEEMVANIDILDAFIDVDFDIANTPVFVRAGRQVINWGESTFVLGGNSVFNPIDVAAIRRPGAEIKEALLPVEAVYLSASVTNNLSVEAYIGGWSEYELDPSGSPFAGSDALTPGSGEGGNNSKFLVGGAADSGSNRVNWNLDYFNNAATGANTVVAGTGMAPLMIGSTKLLEAIDGSATSDWAARVGTTNSNSYWLNYAPEGEVESFRFNSDDTAMIDRGPDEDGEDGDNIGIALRYYAENLNSTEFGLYYQKHASRIPYVGYRAKTPELGLGTVTTEASVTTRSLHGASSCVSTSWGQATGTAAARALTSTVVAGIDIGASGDITDPHNIWPSIQTSAREAFAEIANDPIVALIYNPDAANLADALGGANAASSSFVYADRTGFSKTAAENAGTAEQQSAAANVAAVMGVNTLANLKAGYATHLNKNGYATADGTVVFADEDSADHVAWDNNALPAGFYYLDAGASAVMGTVLAAVGVTGAATSSVVQGDTLKDLTDATCLIGITNKLADSNTDADPFGDYGGTGGLAPALNWNSELFLYYPEDIEVMGASFSTTLLGWGVQGEVAYRPDFPLLLDTDTTFIASVALQCAFPMFGNTGTNVYSILQVLPGKNCDATVGNETVYGDAPADVMNWDIGTTATFTRSNPVVSALGADIAVLLTEFAGVTADGIEETYFADPALRGTGHTLRLQGICTAGNDIGLAALLAIDSVVTNSCRPTETSYGMVLFGSLTYNNVFGTPLSVSPSIIHRAGLSGFSPSPAGSWREGVHTTSLRINASLQGQWNFGFSYVDYAGDEKYTKSDDQDTAAISISYAY